MFKSYSIQVNQKVLIRLGLLCSIGLSAQTLTGILPQQVRQQVYLTGFNHYKRLLLAETTVDSLGYFTLNYPKEYNGMGVLKTQDNSNLVLMLTEPDIQLTGTHLQDLNGLSYANSPDNTRFVQYAKGQGLRKNASAALNYLADLYQKVPLFANRKKITRSGKKEQAYLQKEEADDDTIRFDTAGTERAVITATGNVGIGVATPSEDLDVNGDLRIRGELRDGANTAGTKGQLLSSTGTSTNWIDTSLTVSTTTATETTFVLAGGNSLTLEASGSLRFSRTDSQTLVLSSSATANVALTASTVTVARTTNSNQVSFTFTLTGDGVEDKNTTGINFYSIDNPVTSQTFVASATGVIEAYNFTPSNFPNEYLRVGVRLQNTGEVFSDPITTINSLNDETYSSGALTNLSVSWAAAVATEGKTIGDLYTETEFNQIISDSRYDTTNKLADALGFPRTPAHH